MIGGGLRPPTQAPTLGVVAEGDYDVLGLALAKLYSPTNLFIIFISKIYKKINLRHIVLHIYIKHFYLLIPILYKYNLKYYNLIIVFKS
jgi:hypothetical protein